jgi:hypothetical protein
MSLEQQHTQAEIMQKIQRLQEELSEISPVRQQKELSEISPARRPNTGLGWQIMTGPDQCNVHYFDVSKTRSNEAIKP